MSKIYVASSWRNTYQQTMVQFLRTIPGVEVYDFHDSEGSFHWKEIEPNWRQASVQRFVEILHDPLAQRAYDKDMKALEESDICVLVLPCGVSSHLELGHHCGQGKFGAVFYPKGVEVDPELMYKMAGLITDDLEELGRWVQGPWKITGP